MDVVFTHLRVNDPGRQSQCLPGPGSFLNYFKALCIEQLWQECCQLLCCIYSWEDGWVGGWTERGNYTKDNQLQFSTPSCFSLFPSLGQYSAKICNTCNSVQKYAIQCKDMHMQCSAEICNSVVRLLIILLQLFWERKGGGRPSIAVLIAFCLCANYFANHSILTAQPPS